MRTDILENMSAELRRMPYRVPEGYFEKLSSSLRHPGSAVGGRRSFLKVIAPYASMAAAFLAVVTAGSLLLKNTLQQDSMTYEDFLVHSDYVISGEYEDDISVIENEIDENDIIEYLIYTGVTAEVIEHSK